MLNGARKPEGRIAVIGGGLVGTETALHLAEQGMHTTLVEMLPKIMNGVAATDQLAYSERIAKADMEAVSYTHLVSRRTAPRKD